MEFVKEISNIFANIMLLMSILRYKTYIFPSEAIGSICFASWDIWNAIGNKSKFSYYSYTQWKFVIITGCTSVIWADVNGCREFVKNMTSEMLRYGKKAKCSKNPWSFSLNGLRMVQSIDGSRKDALEENKDLNYKKNWFRLVLNCKRKRFQPFRDLQQQEFKAAFEHLTTDLRMQKSSPTDLLILLIFFLLVISLYCFFRLVPKCNHLIRCQKVSPLTSKIGER